MRRIKRYGNAGNCRILDSYGFRMRSSFSPACHRYAAMRIKAMFSRMQRDIKSIYFTTAITKVLSNPRTSLASIATARASR